MQAQFGKRLTPALQNMTFQVHNQETRIVDVAFGDRRAGDEEAVRFSSAPGYRDINRAAVREMLHQVGHLQVDKEGVALRGLVIRHLVLPCGGAGSVDTMAWIGENLGRETHVSLMKQFFPAHEAASVPGINRRLTDGEYEEAVAALEKAGLENGWVQD